MAKITLAEFVEIEQRRAADDIHRLLEHVAEEVGWKPPPVEPEPEPVVASGDVTPVLLEPNAPAEPVVAEAAEKPTPAKKPAAAKPKPAAKGKAVAK